MVFTDTQLVAWIGHYFWPFVRISTLFMAAPFFGSQTIVNVRARMALSIAVTLLVVPLLPPTPFIDPLSAQGILVTLQQVLFGLAMGFLLQLAFTALLLGGNGISMPMGLGFANTIDPQNGTKTIIIQDNELPDIQFLLPSSGGKESDPGIVAQIQDGV